MTIFVNKIRKWYNCYNFFFSQKGNIKLNTISVYILLLKYQGFYLYIIEFLA